MQGHNDFENDDKKGKKPASYYSSLFDDKDDGDQDPSATVEIKRPVSRKNKVRKTPSERYNEKKIVLKPHNIIAALFTAFFIANTASLFATNASFDVLSFVQRSNIFVFAGAFAVSLFFSIFVAKCLNDISIISWFLLLSQLIFCISLAICSSVNIYFYLGLAFVTIITVVYVLKDDKLELGKIKSLIKWRTVEYETRILFVICSIFISVISIIRYETFSASTFDFGIFAQMFEYMAKTGLPLTTVERAGLTSHFAVHFSPGFYLLLPFYMLWRSPKCLLVLQAVFVSAGVFPLRKIARQLKMSPAVTSCLVLFYVFYPSVIDGCFYDFHENKFLTLPILYLIYHFLKTDGIQKEKKKYLTSRILPIVIFSLLVLSVKEDAAIYVFAISLYFIFTSKDKKTPVLTMLLSVIYFFFAVFMIQKLGGSAMMSRLSNYYPSGEESFAGIIHTIAVDFGYLISQVFTEDKLSFILWMFVPVLFTPLFNRNQSSLFLLIPFIVINMMSNWIYQYDINFQYTYGSAALIIFSFMLFLANSHICKIRNVKKTILIAALCIAMIFSIGLFSHKASYYVLSYSENSEKYSESEDLLDMIPDDASVTATAFAMPHLTRISDLTTAPLYYGEYKKTDYYVTENDEDSDLYKTMANEMGDDYSLVAETSMYKLYKLNSAD